jgi:phage terminase small subunit
VIHLETKGLGPPMAHPVPGHLSKPSQQWLGELLDGYPDATTTEVRLLVMAAEAWDRAARARRLLDREGLVVTSPQGAKAHPAVAIAKDSMTLFSRLVAQLGLDDVAQPDDDLPRIDRRFRARRHALPAPRRGT